MKFRQLPIVALTSALMAAPTLGVADDDDGWKKVKIEGPDDRKILDVKVKSGLKRQGMTELFFESSEPTFDELDPEVFFPRFPQGAYEWEGKTLDNEEIEGEVWLSHIIPAAPLVASVDGLTENPGFEEDDGEIEKACWETDTEAGDDVVISWDAVTMSHFDMWDVDAQPLLEGEDLRYGDGERKTPLGDTGSFTDDDIEYYEFVAEVDDTDLKMTAVVPPGTTSWTVPAEFIALLDGLVDEDGEPVEEIKFEIIVRVKSGGGPDDDGEMVDSGPGNQSAVENCFAI